MRRILKLTESEDPYRIRQGDVSSKPALLLKGTVTANGKIPKRAKIKLPTFVQWSRLRHNGLVSQRAEEGATYAESGGSVHDQGDVPEGDDDQ